MAKAKKAEAGARWKTLLPFKSSAGASLSSTAPESAVPVASSNHRVEKTSKDKGKGKGKAQPKPRSKKRAAKAAPTTTTTTTASKTRSGQTSKSTAPASNTAASSSNAKPTRVLSDEEDEVSDSAEEDGADEEEEEDEDHDHQLGLRPTLRVVSKATVRRTWKPVNIKTRTHIQTLMSSLFPAAISRARGDKRKIAVQMKLNQLMQKMNDCLSELDVPPPGRDRGLNYGQLTARNRELEATLVPDLEHIRDLELRLEQEQRLAEQDEAELTDFQEKKRALDQRTTQLHRSKLHPLLRDRNLQATTAALCRVDNEYSHLSVADQRLLSMMGTSQGDDFGGSESREPLYNPDQDLMINKASKRLGSRLSAIERNGEKLDPMMNLLAAAKEKVQELSVSTFGSNPQHNDPFMSNIMSPLRP